VDIDFWVLADRVHPLLLKIVTGSDVLQVVRVEVPGALESIEATLKARCEAELPGVYFAFNSAVLEPQSAMAIQEAKRLIERHPEWILDIGGHTDNVGGAAANQSLSVRRAESVRAALLAVGVAPTRLRATGFGASRPRESNATLEGRASNRRVELSRPCPTRPSR
jgi:outer membrane protein OmpA-like peptidoglycan-associated protein